MDDILNKIGQTAQQGWNTVAQDFGHAVQGVSQGLQNIGYNAGQGLQNAEQTVGNIGQDIGKVANFATQPGNTPLDFFSQPQQVASTLGDMANNIVGTPFPNAPHNAAGQIMAAMGPENMPPFLGGPAEAAAMGARSIPQFLAGALTAGGIGTGLQLASGQKPEDVLTPQNLAPQLLMGGIMGGRRLEEPQRIPPEIDMANIENAEKASVAKEGGLVPFNNELQFTKDAWDHFQTIKDKIKPPTMDSILGYKNWEDYKQDHPNLGNHTVEGTNSFDNYNGNFGMVPTDANTIPPQRPMSIIDKEHIQRIMDNDMVAVLKPNGDGSYSIFDGNHDIKLARGLGFPEIPSLVLGEGKPVPEAFMDAKNPIGGEGSFTSADIKQWAPEYATDKGKAKVQSMLDKAEKNQSSFDEILKPIAEHAGLDPNQDFESRIKKPDTFIQKIAKHRADGVDEYGASGVNDAYGARYIADTPAEKGQIISEINQLERDGQLKIEKQQQVTKDTYSAYHIDFIKNGVRGEIQIHDPNSLLESVANHEIRAQAGENPPPNMQSDKEANARASQGMPPDAAQALAQATEKANAQGKPSPLEQFGGEPGQPGGNRPGYIPPSGETKNQVNLTINGANDNERIQAAIVNSERIKNEINVRGKDAYIAGSKLSAQDLKLAEQYQEGVPIDTLAKQAQNPKAFTTFMNKITDYYDFRLAADHAVGGDTPRRENYLRQRWDLSDPQDLNNFNELLTQKGQRPWNGYSAQPRVFDTYAQGEAAGFKRLNPDILGDLKDDFGGASTAISQQALKQGLAQAVPDKVSSQGVGFTAERKPFINSNISGLEGMSFHPDVNKRLQGYQPLAGTDLFSQIKDKGFIQGLKDTGTLNTIASLYDHASSPMKQFLLNFSGFHSLNISGNYTGASIFHPVAAIRGLAESVPSFMSEGLTQRITDGFKNKMIPGQDYSVFDAGLRAGVNMDRGLPAQGLQRINPFTMLQRAMFDRELYTLKLNLVDQVFGDGQLDPQSPQGRAAGQEITKIMGEINTRTMNINPNAMKWASRAFLAPQFTLSKYSLLADAALKGGSAGNLARTAVFGKSLVFGTLATFGTLLATGQYPNLQQILTNYTVNPSVQTNLTNPQGRQQDIRLPTTFLSEPARPIAGLLQGSTDELLHYGQARLNPLVSGAQAVLTNKDYYGNPIVNPNSQTPGIGQMAKNIGVSKLPIGVQALVNTVGGKITPTQAAIQIAGLRTTTNPNDPTMRYFAALKTARDSLTNPDDQKAFDLIHPQTKDNQGNPLIDKNAWSNPAKYDTLLAYPRVLAAEQAFQKGQPNHDPMWDLSPNQLHAFLQYEVISKNDPGGDKTTTKALIQALPQGFMQQRKDYYASLNLPAPNTPQAPQMTPEVSQFWSQYAQLPYGTGARSQALNTPLGQMALQQLNAEQQFTNQQRIDMGLPPLAQPQQSSFGGGGMRGLSSRLAIRGGGGGLRTKIAPTGVGTGGRMLAGSTMGRGKMITAGIKIPPAPKGIKMVGGTAGKIKGLSLKTASIKQPKLQQFKMPPIQRINLKRLGGGYHSPRYGKYSYQ